MKKWRISRRSAFEEEHRTSNDVHSEDSEHLSPQEYLRVLDENDLMVVEVCKKTLLKRERLTGRCQGKNNRIHSQSSWILKML